MKKNHDAHLKSLIGTENEQLKKLNQIVADSIREENLLSQKLSESGDEKLTFGEKLADKVAEFGGSWTFIIAFLTILLFWIILNSIQLLSKPFDPYPYILLNLVLSCIAALQAPVIMMSQNRQEEKDRKRSVNDYLVNLKAEIEIRHLHQKIDLLMAEQFKNLMEIQKLQMDSLQKLNDKLDKHLGK